MTKILITNAKVVNEGIITEQDILIDNGLIDKTGGIISADSVDRVIDAAGKFLLPGIIDDQVHFREPGLTHKGDIYTEAKAAVAGGVTSYMEMPNTIPNAVTLDLLEEKYNIADQRSLANYSFYLGATLYNINEIVKADPKKICGLKIFMGSSTGNMLVNNETVLEEIFSKSRMLITTHCEDEETVKRNLTIFKVKYGDDCSPARHSEIRNEEACFKSSSLAVNLAKKYKTRLHVLHISTARELELFSNTIPLREKRITAEVCIHHLFFDNRDYERLGNLIKWNPAIKSPADKEALFLGMMDNHLDVIATDHAPHTLEEKSSGYFEAPSGGPLIQHSLQAMLEFYHKGRMSIEKIVEKMCHAPAECFRVSKRGYIREGYWADLVLADTHRPIMVTKENILAKCGWSPFEGYQFNSSVTHTLVSGNLVYENGQFNESVKGKRLEFDR
jgi:dihydroorotase